MLERDLQFLNSWADLELFLSFCLWQDVDRPGAGDFLQ